MLVSSQSGDQNSEVKGLGDALPWEPVGEGPSCHPQLLEAQPVRLAAHSPALTHSFPQGPESQLPLLRGDPE